MASSTAYPWEITPEDQGPYPSQLCVTGTQEKLAQLNVNTEGRAYTTSTEQDVTTLPISKFFHSNVENPKVRTTRWRVFKERTEILLQPGTQETPVSKSVYSS